MYQDARCLQLLTLYGTKIQAGFPSPADDYIESQIDLNKHLIKHPAATFFVRAKGDAMVSAGIFQDDILIVDRSLKPDHGKIAIIVLEDQFVVKRLHKKNNRFFLLADNQKAIEVKEESETYIWGIVTTVIHSV